jgi:NitT/TauT family transport system permease protein
MKPTERAAEQLQRAARKNTFTNSALGRWTIRIGTLVLVLVVWELGARDISRALTAPPSEIAVAAFDQLFVTGSVWPRLLDSLTILVSGLSIALVAGLIIGIAMGRWKALSNALDPYVTFFF